MTGQCFVLQNFLFQKWLSLLQDFELKKTDSKHYMALQTPHFKTITLAVGSGDNYCNQYLSSLVLLTVLHHSGHSVRSQVPVMWTGAFFRQIQAGNTIENGSSKFKRQIQFCILP